MVTTRRNGLAVLTAAVALVTMACSSDPVVVASGGESGDASVGVVTTATTTTIESASTSGLTGSWFVIAIDEQPVDGSTTLSFFGTDDEPQISVEDECGRGTVSVEPTSEAPVRSTSGLERLCMDVWSEIFGDGQSVTVSLPGRLELTSGGHEVIGRHFESVSEVGSVPEPGEVVPQFTECSPRDAYEFPTTVPGEWWCDE